MIYNFILQRKTISDVGRSTIGELYDDNGIFNCYTLEDLPQQYKIPGETRIDAGTYKVVITYSPRFKRDMPLLLNVENFTGIRFHIGNFAADTDGCVLVGMSKDDERGIIFNSKVAYNKLFYLIKEKTKGDNELYLTIKDENEEEKPNVNVNVEYTKSNIVDVFKKLLGWS